MKKRLLIFLLFTFLLIPAYDAGASDPGSEKIDISSLSNKNPFKSQLPEKPKPKPKPVRERQKRTPSSGKKSGKKFLKTPSGDLRKRKTDMTQRVPTKPALVITGLVWDTKRPQAIVNGKVVSIGDKINNNKIEIVSIRKDGIDIMFEGAEMTIEP